VTQQSADEEENKVKRHKPDIHSQHNRNLDTDDGTQQYQQRQ
jgi:hypothetical protein